MAERFFPVADVAEIPVGAARSFAIGDREIAVFNVNGAFYALDDICPHQGASLHEGWVEAGTVTCPLHAWCFRLSDGTLTLGGAGGGVDAFAVRVEDGRIAVGTTPLPREDA